MLGAGRAQPCALAMLSPEARAELVGGGGRSALERQLASMLDLSSTTNAAAVAGAGGGMART